MTHGMTEGQQDALQAIPHITHDFEQLSVDMTALAVQRKDGPLLQMSGIIDHLVSHLYEVCAEFGMDVPDGFEVMPDE